MTHIIRKHIYWLYYTKTSLQLVFH